MGSACSKPSVNDEENEKVKEKKKAGETKGTEKDKDQKKNKLKTDEKPDILQLKNKLAQKIQAWWRGILVRRTLLHAALRIWTIQSWWRRILSRKLESEKKAVLETSTRLVWATVTLQSWVRMWLTRQKYYRLRHAVCIIQGHWRDHICKLPNIFIGSYELTSSQLKLQLDISLGSQICRITDCIPFPIKN